MGKIPHLRYLDFGCLDAKLEEGPRPKRLRWFGALWRDAYDVFRKRDVPAGKQAFPVGQLFVEGGKSGRCWYEAAQLDMVDWPRAPPFRINLLYEVDGEVAVRRRDRRAVAPFGRVVPVGAADLHAHFYTMAFLSDEGTRHLRERGGSVDYGGKRLLHA